MDDFVKDAGSNSEAKVVDIYLEPFDMGRRAILAVEFDRNAQIGGQSTRHLGFELDEEQMVKLGKLLVATVAASKVMKGGIVTG